MHITKDTVAVVTGAGNGIGLALSKALIERGARVALADVAADRVAQIARELGDRARGYACDVTDRLALAELAGSLERDFGGVDLVFANAGIVIGGKLVEMDSREIEWLYDVNVRGMIETVRAFHPLLVARAASGKSVRVIFTGSENSLGLPELGPASVYNSTKHAMLGIADALRAESEGTGVGVSILCPGVTMSRMWDSRSVRQDRYGGPVALPQEQADRVSKWLADTGQDPALTARICLEGIEADEFIIISDPSIRTLVERRQAQIATALDRVDERIARYAGDSG